MNTKQALRRLYSKTELFLKRNGSTVLTVTGSIGVGATAVLAAKVTPKAIKLLDQATEEKGEKLTKLETVKIVGPTYTPSIIMGAATISCIFGANMLNMKRQAALMSAYALIDNSYKEYKKHVEELYGKGVNDNIKAAIAKGRFQDNIVVEKIEDGEKELFYDEFSKRYFRSTKLKIKEAECLINRDLKINDHAYANDFYKYLDLEPLDDDWELGWTNGGNLELYWQDWIDFSYHKFELDDGLEVTMLTMVQEPYPLFGNF